MRKIKKTFFMITIFAICAALATSAAFADWDGEPVAVRTDSDNELLYAEAPEANFSPSPNGPLMLGAAPEEKSFSCTSFIENSKKSAYIDRMMQYYMDTNPALLETVKNGESVIMLFEGGSDNANAKNARDTGFRDAAVCIVLKYDTENETPYIAYHCENCTTMPDYPLSTEYDNGHTGYGTATLVDGVYSIYTVNHRSTHAGYSIRQTAANNYRVPCLYLKDDGSFSVLDGTGINIHTRMQGDVSGDPLTPTSAGCILVGDSVPFDDYRKFINISKPASVPLTEVTFNDYPIDMYDAENGVYTGMVVVDRYLYKNEMKAIYGRNSEAVELITAFSTSSQNDSKKILNNCTFYPSYLTASVKRGVTVKELPDPGSETIGKTAYGKIKVTGLYENNGNYWYRVVFGQKTGYISASDVIKAMPQYDDISIHSENWPTVKQFKKSFSVSGIVAAAYNKCETVTGWIKATDGTVESSYSCSIPGNLKTLSLNHIDGADAYKNSIDYNLKFGSLPIGKHIYQVTATATNYFVKDGKLTSETKEITVLDKEFTVAALVSFDAGEGTVSPKSAFTDENGRLSELPVPERDGFVFDGWYDAAENGNRITPKTVFEADTTIYAHWKKYIPRPHHIDTDTTYTPPVIKTIPFTDVNSVDWFYDDVLFAYNEGIMNGTTADKFSPSGTTTRGMIAAILYRLEGQPTVLKQCPFADVKPGSYCEKAITWAAENGIVTGYSSGNFGPDDTVTREQLVTMLYRYAKYKKLDVSVGEDTNILSYSDAFDISNYAYSAFQWACGENIINGIDGSLKPQGEATRAQVAAMIHRFCESGYGL